MSNPEVIFESYGNKLIGAAGGGSGSGGHTIQDAEGTDLDQQDTMQFADAFVSDDSVNSRTVVENIKEVLPSDYDSTTDEGIIVCDDGNDVPIGEIGEDSVSVTSSGDTYRSLINKLRNEIDFSKVTDYSYIKLNGKKFICTNHDSGELQFTNVTAYSPTSSMNTIFIFPTDNGRYYTDTMQNGSAPTVADSSTSNVTDGTKLTLYYGTSSTVINLKTDANYCQYDENTTVKDKLTWKKLDGTSIPTNAIPESASEIYVKAITPMGSNYVGMFGAPILSLVDGFQRFIGEKILIHYSTTTRKITQLTLTSNDGTAYTATAIEVYYR